MRKGIGSLVVLVLVALMVLLVITLGHDRFSFQVLSGTRKLNEEAMAIALAQNAIQEASFELSTRVNEPGDELYDLFRQPPVPRSLPARALRCNDRDRGHLFSLLREKAYRSFNFEDYPVQVAIVMEQPFAGYAYDTYGTLQFLSTATYYPPSRPGEKVTRTVEVRQEFKTVLVGPPPPFDKMLFFLHDGARFLALDRTGPADIFVNGNLLIQKLTADLEEIAVARGKLFQLLDQASAQAGQPIGGMTIDPAALQAFRAQLERIRVDGLERLMKYRAAYPTVPFRFPEPTVLLSLSSTGRELQLEKLGPTAWAPREPRWTELHEQSNALIAQLESAGGGLPDISRLAPVVSQLVECVRLRSELDHEILFDTVFPPYFDGCALGGRPRLVHAVGAGGAGPAAADPVAHYRQLLDELSPAQEGFRRKPLFVVAGPGGGGINAAFEELRTRHSDGGHAFNGLVVVRNTGDDVLELSGAFRGRLMVIVEGAVRVTDAGKANDASLLTVVAFGPMSVEGDVKACLIARGPCHLLGSSGPTITGSLILDSYTGDGPVPGLRGTLRPDLRLVASSQSDSGEVAVFPDHRLVALSPSFETRAVTRAEAPR